MADARQMRATFDRYYKSGPVSYSTLKKLYGKLKKDIKEVKKGNVESYLMSQRIHGLYSAPP